MAWEWFTEACCNKYHLANGFAVPPDTTHILLLGSQSLNAWAGETSLLRNRGAPLDIVGIPATASFHPQDSFDWFHQPEEIEDNTKEQDEKNSAKTSPSNFMFWLQKDVNKLLNVPRNEPQPEIIVYPNLQVIINQLKSAKDQQLFIDIETRSADNTLLCVGLAINNGPIYVVPVYRHDGNLAYSNVHLFLQALTIAFKYNKVVVHNALFDLLILAWKYRVPPPSDIFDTMLSQHRIFPEAEKSLGHAISLWTWLPFHKGDYIDPLNQDQEQQLYHYNAKDVHGMRRVFTEQAKYIETNSGLRDSVHLANQLVRPYLIATLTGIRINEDMILTKRMDNLRLLKQWDRIFAVLTGVKNFNPCSSAQCIELFHNKLEYPVMDRSRKTQNASLSAKALYKLALNYEDPLIRLTIAYREKVKQNSQLVIESFQL